MVRVGDVLINHCGQCPHHKVEADPDPLDSLCGDDQKVVCTKAKRAENEIVVGCRPYQVVAEVQEAGVPNWCPLKC